MTTMPMLALTASNPPVDSENTGGSIWRAVGNGVFSASEGPAFAAWSQAVTHPGDPVGLVRAAVLAANNHNTQPWRFVIRDAAIDLYADMNRTTGALDPTLRELHISLGAALENLNVAAGPNGFATEISLFPSELDPLHVAHVALAPAPATGSAAFDAIPNRHTNRLAFDATRPPTDAQLSELRSLNDDGRIDLLWLTDPSARAAFGDLTIRATEAILANEQQSSDNFVWFRGNWDELQASKDGLTIDTSGLSSLMRAIVKIVPVTNQARFGQSWLKMTKHPQLSTAPAFGIIIARNESEQRDFISAGRLYQRISLQATTSGLALQPLNQIPEHIDWETSRGRQPAIESELSTLLDLPGATALMPFRIGYPLAPGLPSPRRPADRTIQKAAPA